MQPRAAQTHKRLLSWIATVKNRPFFAYVHYMEPHIPYVAHDFAIERAFGAVEPDLAMLNQQYLGADVERRTPEILRDIRRAYDASVMTLDFELGRLLRRMAKKGLLSNTIVVFTADHGDEFIEHGSIGHGHTLYDEVVRVPLLILMPGQDKRVDVEAAVSIMDLAPTLIELSGAAVGDSFEGTSLARGLESALELPDNADPWSGVDARPQVVELMIDATGMASKHRRAIIHENYKLISTAAGDMEFYDTQGDPLETVGAKGAEAERSELERLLASLEARGPSDSESGPAPGRAFDEETREQLRALGYLGDSGDTVDGSVDGHDDESP